MKLIALIALLGTAVALPASANYLVSSKSVCADTVNNKLVKQKLTNEAVIARCLGVGVTDPSVAAHALTFDSDFRELHVIRRCDSLVVCDMSTQLDCETAGAELDTKAACIYRLLDFGEFAVEGTMLCKETEKYSFKTHKYSFKAQCAGALELGTEVCAIAFSSGKLFQQSGVCP